MVVNEAAGCSRRRRRTGQALLENEEVTELYLGGGGGESGETAETDD